MKKEIFCCKYAGTFQHQNKVFLKILFDVYSWVANLAKYKYNKIPQVIEIF